MGFLLIGITVSAIAFSQNDSTVRYFPWQTTHYFKLGSTIIQLKQFEYGANKNIVMINLHDDEITAVDAANKVLQNTGGILIKIENKNQRLVTFRLNKRQYKFDPNRIFSRSGIIATLKKNKSYSILAVKQIQAFASFVIKKIPADTKTLIAIHNNDEERLSISSYQKGGYYEKDVKKLNIQLSEDPDNFYFTTDKNIFYILSSLRYNVVLQENEKARNDGSLSVYYGRRNMSYVNVEVNRGQLERQSEMIKVLIRNQNKF